MTDAQVLRALQTHWGYDSFRPLQREAIDAVLTGRDSVVVLPTGGGKSLCYQVPAVLMDGLAVVVSPLISLMKDQVDGLTECGIPAAAVHSALEPREREIIAKQIRDNSLKLLYVAPERLCTERMLDFLAERKLSFIAIDEAHCISNWGHDFRPEYRMLGELRQRFPGVGVHGYTATATEDVRKDIAVQLRLKNAEFLVGSFDRPNLQYRVMRKNRRGDQILEVLERHKGESGIIYCISRKEVDALSITLQAAGYKAAPYHAGMADVDRHKNQDAFLNEQVDIVVATVAFGMGIDKPNVRFVLHTGSPKSLEHYQQETGRAGRDGLDSECALIYSGSDFLVWRRLNDQLTGAAKQQMEHQLRVMESFCTGVTCRHRALVEHFGQTYEADNCGACDVCLDQQAVLPDALVTAQKILSCVVRVNENFGGDYVANVLVGSREQRILENGHDQLSTYGLLKEQKKATIREWIEQLCGQDLIVREGEYRLLKVSPTGWEVLRGQRTPRLLAVEKRSERGDRPRRSQRNFSIGMDAGLFEALRILRRQLAEAANVPPYVVFGDVTLQDLSRRRPTSLGYFQMIHGVGEHRLKHYGETFIAEIVRYCHEHNLTTDVAVSEPSPEQQAIEAFRESGKSSAKSAAAQLFNEGKSVAEVAQQLGRAESTVGGYLGEYLQESGRISPEPWADGGTYEAVIAAIEKVGMEKLRPIFDYFEGKLAYDAIRACVICYQNRLALESSS